MDSLECGGMPRSVCGERRLPLLFTQHLLSSVELLPKVFGCREEPLTRSHIWSQNMSVRMKLACAIIATAHELDSEARALMEAARTELLCHAGYSEPVRVHT